MVQEFDEINNNNNNNNNNALFNEGKHYSFISFFFLTISRVVFVHSPDRITR
jgi:hypothetical protein